MLSIGRSAQLVLLYSTVDDLLKMQSHAGEWRMSNNKPRFTDAEVLTIALMQSYFRTDTLKRAYLLVKANDPTAFRELPSYKQWINRLHLLTRHSGTLIFQLPLKIADMAQEVYLIDSYPVRMCETIRHGRVNLLRDEGAYFGKSSTGWFFGFKLHVLTTRNGQIIGAVLTNGNVEDRAGARLLLGYLEEGSLCLGDLGYRGDNFQTEMFEDEGVLVLTRRNMPSAELKKLHSQIRNRIETTFSQLWRRFTDRVYSRSWRGLWNTLLLKMLDCKLCQTNILPNN
jgi:transposase